MAISSEQPRLAVLMCTYNGAAHLAEQLDSILAQDYAPIDIYVSDDGSSDATLDLLLQYQRNWTPGHFEIRQGPREGFAANFLSLACDASIDADYFAYCDQDDIWLPDKLERALSLLRAKPGFAALYCSRTRLMEKSGEPMNRTSPLFRRPPSFANALVQSLAGGNTMVFNRPARALLVQAGPKKIVSHDWWTYLLVTGGGGEVYYDRTPMVLYRQHDNNLIGSNRGWEAKWRRVRMILAGDFRDWNDLNLNALAENRQLLNSSSRQTIDMLIAARQAPLLKRIFLMYKSRVYRQTLSGNLALIVAGLAGKI